MNKASVQKKKKLQEKLTVIITGASSGIGKEVSLALASLNPNLVIVARREKKIKQTAHLLKKEKIRVLPITGDVRNSDDRIKIINHTMKAFGKIDVLINNAGLGKVNLFLEQPEEEIDQLIETNVLALIKLTQQVLRIMKNQGCGHIINISSSLAYIPPYPFAVYSATKSAVKVFSDCIREEAKSYGVKISTVLPGPYNTEFNKVAGVGNSSFKGYDTSKLARKIVRLIKKPKEEIIQPWFFVPLIWLSKIFPSVKKKVTSSIAESLLLSKEKTKIELLEEEKIKKKEAVKVLTH